MNVKNAILICFNNFMLVFKQLIYSLIIVAVLGFCLYGITSPIVKLLDSNGWMLEVGDFVYSLYTDPKNIATNFKDIASSFYTLFTSNFSTLWGNYIVSVCLIVLVPIFTGCLANYVLGDVVNAKMNSWVNYGYANRFFSTLKKNVVYSLFMTLLTLPAFACVIGLVILYGVLGKTFLLATVLLPVLVLAIILVLALKNTFLMWIMPICVNEETRVVKAISKSFVLGGKNFGRAFLGSFLLYLLDFVAVMIGLFFSLGAGLIIILPAIPVVNTAFSVTSYYQSEKLRYYINEFTIVNPR